MSDTVAKQTQAAIERARLVIPALPDLILDRHGADLVTLAEALAEAAEALHTAYYDGVYDAEIRGGL